MSSAPIRAHRKSEWRKRVSGTRRKMPGLERKVRRKRGEETVAERIGREEHIGGRGRRTAAFGGGEKRAPPRSASAAEGSTARTVVSQKLSF